MTFAKTENENVKPDELREEIDVVNIEKDLEASHNQLKLSELSSEIAALKADLNKKNEAAEEEEIEPNAIPTWEETKNFTNKKLKKFEDRFESVINEIKSPSDDKEKKDYKDYNKVVTHSALEFIDANYPKISKKLLSFSNNPQEMAKSVYDTIDKMDIHKKMKLQQEKNEVDQKIKKIESPSPHSINESISANAFSSEQTENDRLLEEMYKYGH